MNRRKRMRNRIIRSVAPLNARIVRSVWDRNAALYFRVQGRYLVKLFDPFVTQPLILFPGLLAQTTVCFSRGTEVLSSDANLDGEDSPFPAPINFGDSNEPDDAGPRTSATISEGNVTVGYDPAGDPPYADNWYYLMDFNLVERFNNTSGGRNIAGELVQVASVNTSTHEVTFKHPVGRTYASGSRLSDTASSRVLTKIGIRGRASKSFHATAHRHSFTGSTAGRFQ